MNDFKTLEFDTILDELSSHAVSAATKKRCKALIPANSIEEAKRLANETTNAKKIIEQIGTPPIAIMADLEKIIGLINADAMLVPEQIGNVVNFLISCNRMKAYLKRAESTQLDIAFYGNSIVDLSSLEEEINRCLHNDQINDHATPKLHDLRRSIDRKGEQIKAKIESLLQKNKQYCMDGFVAVRNGRYTMPVKKEYKNKIPGILVEISNTGGTCFIEPTAVSKLQDELSTLKIEEDNEVRTVLYTLTALIHEELSSIKTNIEAMETLDFVFAKAKLSLSIKATQIRLTEDREIRLLSARHPLLKHGTVTLINNDLRHCNLDLVNNDNQQDSNPVPLDFALGQDSTVPTEGSFSQKKSNPSRGIIITGPNTGGKTVALKTVGLLSLMAQSGLHVPADERSSICIFDSVWCDIGDGQSISQNLSTFSSHMNNIIGILEKATDRSLVLFDELGSGTDPAEGMGIATAILEELLAKGCLFTVTTHYPEIKDFAARTIGVVNARMAFDRESLMPLYRLEIGEAGESCALYIAERLGLPKHLLNRAREITYSSTSSSTSSTSSTSSSASSSTSSNTSNTSSSASSNTSPGTSSAAYRERRENTIIRVTPSALKDESEEELEEQEEEQIPRSQQFVIGDSVTVYPKKDIGIVYEPANNKGEIGVQIKGEKYLINHKRIKLKIAAAELYPEDYDFSIIFDSVKNRKARHLMGRKHVADNVVIYPEG